MNKTDWMKQLKERYDYHQAQTSDSNPIVAEFARDMAELDLLLMGLLEEE